MSIALYGRPVVVRRFAGTAPSVDTLQGMRETTPR